MASDAFDTVMHEIAAPSSAEVANESCALLQLSAKLLDEVSSYIKNPRDLRSLCLTCRKQSSSTVPLLYRSITFPTNKIDEKLLESFHRRNRGVVHIRYLQVKEPLVTYKSTIQENCLFSVLNVLPRDKLELLYIDSASEMTPAVDSLVLQAQRELPMLVLHPNMRTQFLFAIPPNRVQTLTSLALFIKTNKDVERCQGILQRLVNLTDLSVVRVTYFLQEEHQKLPVSSAFIVQTLFSPNAESNAIRLKLKLKRLYLTGFDFSDCRKELVDCLEISELMDLALLFCATTWRLVNVLLQHDLSLETFIDDRFEDWRRSSTSISQFLKSSHGLKVFKRTYLPAASAEPKHCKGITWSDLQTHSKTLEILHLDDALIEEDSWGFHRSMDDFRTPCGTLTRLEQLAVRPPDYYDEDTFCQFLECLRAVKRLTSLKLYINPPRSRTDRSDLIQCLANVIFELYEHCPRFTALLLRVNIDQGESGKSFRGDADEYGYLRNMNVDEFRKGKNTAQPLPPEELQYHEPCSDIFSEHTDDTWHLKHAIREYEDKDLSTHAFIPGESNVYSDQGQPSDMRNSASSYVPALQRRSEPRALNLQESHTEQ